MSNGEGQDMAVVGSLGAMVKGSDRERVVLRGVQVIVLDDLSAHERLRIREACGGDDLSSEAWIVEALAPGSFDVAVEAHAGKSGEEDNKPGRYRAVKKAAWLEKGPRVIEPPIA